MTTQQELDNTIDHILTLYPEDPAVGSPYGTGNELFGLPASYKRHSSISKYQVSPSGVLSRALSRTPKVQSADLITRVYFSGRLDLGQPSPPVLASRRKRRAEIVRLSVYPSHASSPPSIWW